jgi:serine/threonine-protein kinase RsbW
MTETANTERVQTQLPDLEITLPARAENVAVVRHAVGGLGEVLEVDDQTLSDIKLAVTEACTNVVRHAYPDGHPGAVEISIEPREERVRIVVADSGRGIGTSTDTSGPGLGLPLIAAIADAVDLQSAPNGGSRVAMTFRRRDPGQAA